MDAMLLLRRFSFRLPLGLLPDRIDPDADSDPSDRQNLRANPHPADSIRWNPPDADGSADYNSKMQNRVFF